MNIFAFYGQFRQWVASFGLGPTINPVAIARLSPGLSYYSQFCIAWCERQMWQRLGLHAQAVMVGFVLGAVLGYSMIGLCVIGLYFAANEAMIYHYSRLRLWVSGLLTENDGLGKEEVVAHDKDNTQQTCLEALAQHVVQNVDILVYLREEQTAALQAVVQGSTEVQANLSGMKMDVSVIDGVVVDQATNRAVRANLHEDRKESMAGISHSVSVLQQILAQHRQAMSAVDAEIEDDENEPINLPLDPNGNVDPNFFRRQVR